MKILKFGGTSIQGVDEQKRVLTIILDTLKNSQDIALVFSACGKTTDRLQTMGYLACQGKKTYLKQFQSLQEEHLCFVQGLLKDPSQVQGKMQELFLDLKDLLKGVFLLQELSLRSLDLILSYGERFSTLLMSEALCEHKVDAHFLDARKIICTDDSFSEAQVDFKVTYRKIRHHFKQDSSLKVVNGFVGCSKKGETSTLGRGGSDLTAAILGAALEAKEVEIWTDVDGVMTVDPRKVGQAFSIAKMSYDEAAEMSHFGAAVIHTAAMAPLLDLRIPLRIRNTFNTTFPGTVICEKAEDSSHGLICGISSLDKISLLRLQGVGMMGIAGIAMRVFGSLATENINVILVTQASSEYSITLAVDPSQALRAKQLLEQEFLIEMKRKQITPPIIENDLSIIAVVGDGMRKTSGISGRLFSCLGRNGINIIAVAQGSSERNISFVVQACNEKKALQVAHEAFFLSDKKVINLFLLGATGLIGRTLFSQIQSQKKQLEEKFSLEIRLIGLCNSKKMRCASKGLSWDCSLEVLMQKGEQMSLESFIEKMKEYNLSNSVFVDCSASDVLPNVYKQILDANISIVTPNKKANSTSFSLYKDIKKTAYERGVGYFYETNVGAGLPVIHTLQELLSSGDKILKIEGILSGTISYIFNNLVSKTAFSAIVKQAKEQGYTEPDPRDDLNGLDVARKLLILVRDSGYTLELKDIEVQSLVPDFCRKAKDTEEFFALLEKADADFEARRIAAQNKGKVLRYLACFENSQARVSLCEVGSEHPAYYLKGSDNFIAFTTKRYKKTPLVVKGPGAGAEVTAAGVFANIMRIVNR